MRVIDHKSFKAEKKSGHKLKNVVAVIVIAVMMALIYEVSVSHILNDNKAKAPTITNVQTTTAPTTETKNKLKEFTPEQFRDLYKTFVFPNTQKISETTPITTSEELDNRIRTLAQAKGYVIRSAPIVDNFIAVDAYHKLQQKAYTDWIELRDNAQKERINIKIVAGYRSAEDQKEIFLSRLGYNATDAQINYVLTTTAPPGYSRHHTGYTVDLACTGYEGNKFENTPCYSWLSKNNYENTKKFGWIPSYPAGAVGQGPEPESWEYVWVSKDSTHQ